MRDGGGEGVGEGGVREADFVGGLWEEATEDGIDRGEEEGKVGGRESVGVKERGLGLLEWREAEEED